MPVATPHGPDGKQLSHAGKLLVYERENEHRAFLSAQKAWWPIGPAAKRGLGPEWGRPPEGSEVHMDGRPFRRFERVPVFADNGELVATKLEWVDIAAAAREEEEAKALDAMRKKLAAAKKADK